MTTETDNIWMDDILVEAVTVPAGMVEMEDRQGVLNRSRDSRNWPTLCDSCGYAIAVDQPYVARIADDPRGLEARYGQRLHTDCARAWYEDDPDPAKWLDRDVVITQFVAGQNGEMPENCVFALSMIANSHPRSWAVIAWGGGTALYRDRWQAEHSLRSALSTYLDKSAPYTLLSGDPEGPWVNLVARLNRSRRGPYDEDDPAILAALGPYAPGRSDQEA